VRVPRSAAQRFQKEKRSLAQRNAAGDSRHGLEVFQREGSAYLDHMAQRARVHVLECHVYRVSVEECIVQVNLCTREYSRAVLYSVGESRHRARGAPFAVASTYLVLHRRWVGCPTPCIRLPLLCGPPRGRPSPSWVLLSTTCMLRCILSGTGPTWEWA
jgi:hypothetical protein